MKLTRMKYVRSIFVLALFALFILGISVAWSVYLHSLRVRAICDANHVAALEACRELSKQISTGSLQSGLYSMNSEQDRIRLDLPPCILELKPHVLYLYNKEDGRIQIGLSRIKRDSIGLEAYPEGVAGPAIIDQIGKRELIPGLWFYESLMEENPEYFGKKVDRIISHWKLKQKEKLGSTI